MEGRLKVAKWGNSLSVRLPKTVADRMQVEDKDEVEFKVVGRRLVLEPDDETGLLARIYREHPLDYDIDTELVDKGGAMGEEPY